MISQITSALHNYVVVYRRTPTSKPTLTPFYSTTVQRIMGILKMIESEEYEVEVISISMLD